MIFVSDKKKGSYGNKTDNLKIPDSALNHDIHRRHASAIHTRGHRTHMDMAKKIIAEALKETALLIRFSRCFIRMTGRRRGYAWKMHEEDNELIKLIMN